MKNSEHFALNQWITDYPTDLTYAEIISLLRENPDEWSLDEITVWEVVEKYSFDLVADFIEDTRKAFERATSEVTSSGKGD